MKKLLACVVAALAVTGLLGTGAASPSGAVCRVDLRVNVFGASSPQSSWALQGGLTAGRVATLRAVAHGCAIDHITGRFRQGGEGFFPGTPVACSGARCTFNARWQSAAAVDFQAYANNPGGGRRITSNIVHVAWAAAAVIAGSWTWEFAPVGQPLGAGGTVTFKDDHTMTWSGGDSGTWSQSGNQITLVWTSKHPVSHDFMTLSADGRTMTGTNDATPQSNVRGTRQ